MPKASLTVAVVVLNYNTWELATNCLNAAIRLEGDTVQEYLLYDDGSPLRQPEDLQVDQRIKIIRGPANLGFSKALNVAFNHVKTDLIVLFDSDALPLSPFSSRLRERFESDNSLGVLGFKTCNKDGTQTESSFRTPGTWSLLLPGQFYRLGNSFRPSATNLCVIAAGMASRRTAFVAIDGFDEEFDFYDVDVDYCTRMALNGWHVESDPELIVFHEGGGTPLSHANRISRFYKNRLRFISKYGKVRHSKLLKTLLLARLQFDWIFLKSFGPFVFADDRMRSEKLAARESVISFIRDESSYFFKNKERRLF
jgi:GT2 family glycosyltransferase